MFVLMSYSGSLGVITFTQPQDNSHLSLSDFDKWLFWTAVRNGSLKDGILSSGALENIY